jgi:hypothetical protein
VLRLFIQQRHNNIACLLGIYIILFLAGGCDELY